MECQRKHLNFLSISHLNAFISSAFVERVNCSIKPTKNISLKTALRKSFVRFVGSLGARTAHTCRGVAAVRVASSFPAGN